MNKGKKTVAQRRTDDDAATEQKPRRDHMDYLTMHMH